MNNSSFEKRKRQLLDSLEYCDSNKKRIDILVDTVIQLQDSLAELEINYYELLQHSKICVHLPF